MSTRRPFLLLFALTWTMMCLGTLALLAGFYWWLTWPDEHLWQVCASFLWAVLLVAATACLLRMVFAAPGVENARLLMPRAASCAAMALWLILFAALEMALVSMYGGTERVAVRLAQLMHLSPRFTVGMLQGLVCAAIWIVVPTVLLPLGMRMARGGFVGLRQYGLWQVVRSLRYWAGLASALVLLYLSYRLIDWIPERHTLHGEFVSAGWRLGSAYLLSVTAIVVAAWNTGRAADRAEVCKGEASTIG